MSYLPSQFVTCPRCHGSGHEKETPGTVCSNCYGLAAGTFWNGEFLYWGGRLETGPVAVRRAQLWLRHGLIVLLWLVAAVGMGALVYWLLQHAFAAEGIYIGVLVSFWGERDSLLLLFWVGIVAGLYAWYEGRRARMLRPAIPFSCSFAPPPATPNNWQELRRYSRRRDVSRYYSETSLRAVEDAALVAREKNESALTPARLLATFLRKPATRRSSATAWERLLVAVPDVVERCEALAGQAHPTVRPLTVETRQLLIEAYVIASERNAYQVTPLDIWQSAGYLALSLRTIFEHFRITPMAWYRSCAWQSRLHESHLRRRQERRRHRQWHRNVAAANATVATPLLERFTRDLTQEARSVTASHCHPVTAIAELEKRLGEKTAAVIRIQGLPGSGKTSLLRALAERWAYDPCVPHRYRRLALVDIARLTEQADVTPVEALLVVAEEAQATGATVLAVDDVPAEWLPAIAAEPAWPVPILLTGTAFPTAEIDVTAVSDDDCYNILIARAIALETKYAVTVPYTAVAIALRAATQTADRQVSIGRAAGILERAVVRAKELNQTTLTVELAAKAVATDLHMPYTKLLQAMETVS